LVLEVMTAGDVDGIWNPRLTEGTARNGHIAVGEDGDSIHRYAGTDHGHGDAHATGGVPLGPASHHPARQGEE
jgi:hypothetical protein